MELNNPKKHFGKTYFYLAIPFEASIKTIYGT